MKNVLATQKNTETDLLFFSEKIHRPKIVVHNFLLHLFGVPNVMDLVGVFFSKNSRQNRFIFPKFCGVNMEKKLCQNQF